MLEQTLIIGAVTWIAAALIYYTGIRKISINLFDPLLVVGISVPFSASLLAVLCSTALVTWDKFTLFSFVLCAYALGARFAGAFFSRESFRLSVQAALARISRLEVNIILLITVSITFVLAVLGIQEGAAGDARQDFAKVFRPLITLQSGLSLLALVALLSPKLSLSRKIFWLTCLIVLSIPFSGKSVLIPIMFWFGLKLFLERRTIKLRTAALTAALASAGAAFMGILAYGVSGLSGTLFLLANRLWMFGDVYIFAYQQGALESIRSNYAVSFLSYMLHPLTSLVGVRGYDKPLGSTIASELAGGEVFTGPNPQLPVVLDYFFPGQEWISLPTAFIIGLLVFALRPMALTLAQSRSRYVSLGGITAAVFCPAAGFLDTSQVLIALIGILVVTAAATCIEMLLSPMNRSRAPEGHTN